MQTGLDDNWTIFARRRIDHYRRIVLKPGYSEAEKQEAAGIAEWFRQEIATHLARRAADPSNVIQLHHYRRPSHADAVRYGD